MNNWIDLHSDRTDSDIVFLQRFQKFKLNVQRLHYWTTEISLNELNPTVEIYTFAPISDVVVAVQQRLSEPSEPII